MAKPFGDQAGNSMHFHVSLWKDGEPPSPPTATRRTTFTAGRSPASPASAGDHALWRADGQLLQAFQAALVRPSTRTWGHDNRTVAIRSLIESPSATRVELRTGGADAEPHWAIAATLAAIVAAIEQEPTDPGEPGQGNLYGVGDPLPSNLAAGIAAAREDEAIVKILGEDAVHDYTKLAEYEWELYLSTVTDWDRDRYLRSI